jgi:hypothetical protein
MKYYVWLEYYAAAPVSKNVKSDELMFSDKHKHGVQPTPEQKNSLLPSLYTNVEEVYDKYNFAHAAAPVEYPGNDSVKTGRSIKTRSEK